MSSIFDSSTSVRSPPVSSPAGVTAVISGAVMNAAASDGSSIRMP